MDVYIVEDDKVLALILHKMAEKLDLNVVGSSEYGANAINEIKKSSPEIIFMDIYLKDSINGIQVTEEIYNSYSPTVIYITGNSDPVNLEKAKRIGYHDYLTKPVSFNDLKTSLDKIQA